MYATGAFMYLKFRKKSLIFMEHKTFFPVFQNHKKDENCVLDFTV